MVMGYAQYMFDGLMLYRVIGIYPLLEAFWSCIYLPRYLPTYI